MKRRTLLAGTAALAAAPAIGRAAEKTKIVWWHAMTAALGEQVNHLVEAFNQSQDAIEVQAIYKGGYADVLTATIAAFRAGQAPHLAQIFEVGTGIDARRRQGDEAGLGAGQGDRRRDRSRRRTSRRCAAITAWRMDGWRRCRSIHRPR